MQCPLGDSDQTRSIAKTPDNWEARDTEQAVQSSSSPREVVRSIPERWGTPPVWCPAAWDTLGGTAGGTGVTSTAGARLCKLQYSCSSSWTKSHGNEGKCRAPLESLRLRNCTEPSRASQGPRIPPHPADARRSSPYRRRTGCLLSSQLPAPTLSCSQHGLFVQLDPPTREQADNGSPAASKSLVPALSLRPRGCSGHGHRLCLKVRTVHLQSWLV